ncbi:MAG: CDP-alcohol phosphatidyltransferase family protein [Labrys sp. (in: a-proteobacteria)]|jgi:phosphatidylglycerophosphate synthase
MLDGLARRVIDPPLNAAGRRLAAAGVTADGVTTAGLVAGLGAAVAIALHAPLLGLVLIGLSRLLDGLDGAVARASAKTDRGGYLDIVFDFIFYGAVPLAFAVADPAMAIPAAVLLFAFYVNGASFLAYAIFAAKRGLETRGRGDKSLYFTAGLAEGTETIAVFVAMCLWPAGFALLAYGFAALCLVTAAARIRLAVDAFS